MPGIQLLPRRQHRPSEVPRALRSLDKRGYLWVRADPTSPARLEHRVVMERVLGRALVAGETVHHINGIRSDNRPDNLELWVGSPRWGVRASDARCPHCNELWRPAVDALEP